MTKLLNSDFLSELKARIPQNLDYYYEDNIWLNSYFKSLEPLEKEFLIRPVDLQVQESKNDKLDFENIKLLYGALKDMSLSIAADERVWAYMTHITYWDYMKKRWPIENVTDKHSKENFIKTHYFYGEKPRNRNGLARLWWIGYVTYDENLEDKFELTEFMVKNQDQDLTRMIMETATIARNRTAVTVILKVIRNLQNSDPSFSVRSFIRDVAKYINFTGSVTLWDSLDYKEVEESVNSMSEQWIRKKSLIVNQ
ncbi:DUF6339 family protein [Alkalihalobacillus sp. TS-13]|uniref:DUF6339 family protein n=1 Tax=Alkalihalobacillus sp. TS-13 TaxID=2842455 RepID=UPI001C88E171|nr:DUF6339 family protein [Alkalihalobacillus sp. TS-13]